jgi:ribose 5-phosphate isomerase
VTAITARALINAVEIDSSDFVDPDLKMLPKGNGKPHRRKKVSQATGVKTATIVESSKQTVQTQPTPEQVRQRAYEIYASRNGGPGDEIQDWLQAERELRSE